ncbi:MAG: murein biosynthesis integral membrane protein MurJ [Armatimonadota bacterium]|nr:murein biosynthesis integral membrane protein MurJ [Armatimonadota bacterium]MDR7421950.1 murein biosynthesis integral membrane protein MurJ [Armatimonadota bacterium]MDR7453514.1 murein biosynthesis integral membrane protein MurJ [Armatimonadota bacterium]MDR7456979.1 murein biosynthesis integral membrane protein MurJ [Armatimonadota bacterium]MDR7496502.1 murein biosynthesis integral membrane protein MurJ [Armatimonadota bacterium]
MNAGEASAALPGRLARAASFVAAATVASRAMGLLREVVVAALFGASDARAAYVIGYYVPFFVQRLLLGGTLSIVLIPTLADVLARGDRDELRGLTAQLFSAVVAIGVAMVLAGQLVAPLLVPLAAPGFAADPAQLALAVHLTRLNFYSMFFLALGIFATAYLQAQRRFAPPAVAPLVFNAVTIGLTVWLGPRMGIVGLAVAWIAGTAAQFLVQAPAMAAVGFRYGLTARWSHPAVRTVARLAVPAMLGLAIIEINAYVGRFFASLLPASAGVNAVAVLDYAYSIAQAPVGILAISVATVLFPGMSRLAASGQREALGRTTALGLRSVLFLMLPVSAGLVVFARPVVRLLFERGQFGPAATEAVAATLAAYAAGLVPMAAYYVVTRAYYALHDMRTPVRTGAGMVALNAALAYGFMQVWGATGIALAAAAVSATNVGLLLLLLRRRVDALGARELLTSLARLAVAAASALAIWWGIMPILTAALEPWRFAWAAALAVGAAAAAAAYLGLCLVLRVEEARLLAGALLRRAG